jgi:3',5'-cyclic AMP phosphodiesterase CpdA
VLIAHLSDLHLRDTDDAAWFDRQLDRIVARRPDHIAITGDLLDRWHPSLLGRVLDALEERGLLDPARLTILHGNHDLASSGGHPRRGMDLWRLALRVWDPPPIVAWRRRRFYDAIGRRIAGVARRAPVLKNTPAARIAVLDTVPLLWGPVHFDDGIIATRHAIGCIRRAQAAWLSSLRTDGPPLIVLLHHYPLDSPPYQWSPERGSWLPIRGVQVPMHVTQPSRDEFWSAAAVAGVRLVLCGHVHRARLDWHQGIAVGLNGQSGAAWAGRTIAYYEVRDRGIEVEYDTL